MLVGKCSLVTVQKSAAFFHLLTRVNSTGQVVCIGIGAWDGVGNFRAIQRLRGLRAESASKDVERFLVFMVAELARSSGEGFD